MNSITIYHNPACGTSRILPQPQRGAFSKEDGEAVVDAEGRRV